MLLLSRSKDSRARKSADAFVPSLDAGPDIGAALKAARDAKALSLDELAEKTCIRRAYLAALEDMRLDALPSRPFTIGYIRAYANALGLDGEAAVRRFKAEEPIGEEPLRGPVGVERGRDPRLALVGVAGAVIIAAIVTWNVAQRALTEKAPANPAQIAVVSQPVAVAKTGPVSLGAPLPAPVESTTPTPYETPGLAASTTANGSADAAIAAKKAAEETPAVVEALPPAFVPGGAVYGAAPDASTITLQARKGASIIVRGPDGSVYFARQLSAGEAYRAPAIKGLTVDVSDPAAFQVFTAGQSKGVLPAAQTPLGKLEG
jgi:transcriptional regulator with XRE-family HTH domain